MTIAIIVFLVLGYSLIATESINHINKAAVAIFLGALLWCLFILNGSYYITTEHPTEYIDYLQTQGDNFDSIKTFISQHIFIKYVFDACQVVLFFLATMSIVEVLNGNGCFDFITKLLQTNHSRKLLWLFAFISYGISANLDNLTTLTLMLTIMHSVVSERKSRMIYGTIIMLAVNCGGLFTVIGDINSLTLWTKNCVTPTNYAAMLFLPSLLLLVIPTWLIGKKLPEHIDRPSYFQQPYNEDLGNSRIELQKITMLFIGIGGLWFIPTFHRLTAMPPFVGAFCVLGLLWCINELCNLKMIRSGKMVLRHSPIGLQYSNMQMLLFYIGLTMIVGASQEMGILRTLAHWADTYIQNIYIITTLWGALSIILDNMVIILNNISLAPFSCNVPQAAYSIDGIYWILLNYAVTLGGMIVSIGTITGMALMKVEGITLRWYFRHITGKIITGGIVGFIILVATIILTK